MRWLARGEPDLPAALDWLSTREQQALAGIRFTKRRVEFLTRRWTVKQALAAFTGGAVDPAALATIEVGNHPSGAPYALVDGRPTDVGISMTDRAGWAVCLVGGDEPVGVDLELVEPRSDGFVRDFLTAAEQRLVAAADERDVVANLMWSAKEAALKVLQTGLRADTRSVVVDPLLDTPADAAGWRPITITNDDGRRFAGWWRRDGVFVLTVAFTAAPPAPPAVLPGSADLAAAQPIHSWLAQPLVTP